MSNQITPTTLRKENVAVQVFDLISHNKGRAVLVEKKTYLVPQDVLVQALSLHIWHTTWDVSYVWLPVYLLLISQDRCKNKAQFHTDIWVSGGSSGKHSLIDSMPKCT